MQATDILKITYTIRTFDVDAMKSHTRYVYEIFPDGKITYSMIEKGIRKPIDRVITRKAKNVDYNKLCDDINACIDSACTINQYDDDTSADVKLVRPFFRVDIMDSGYSNGETDLRSIITNYLYGIGGISW